MLPDQSSDKDTSLGRCRLEAIDVVRTLTHRQLRQGAETLQHGRHVRLAQIAGVDILGFSRTALCRKLRVHQNISCLLNYTQLH